MSHAWNACGAHAPRGFKSLILRSWETPGSSIPGVSFFVDAGRVGRHLLGTALLYGPSPCPGRLLESKMVFATEFFEPHTQEASAPCSSQTSTVTSFFPSS